MTRYTVTLAGRGDVQVEAPGIGEFDLLDMPKSHLRSNLWGLDVESTALVAGGPWAEGWHVRTIQLAPTDNFVYVLRMDDPDQRLAAGSILSGAGRTFASHTQIDVIGAMHSLGVDITQRSIDTHWLSVMSAPDDVRGQAELKPVAKKFGMPELEQVETSLHAWFLDLYRQAVPTARARPKKSDYVKFGFDNAPVDDPLFVHYAGLDAVVVRRLVPLLVAQTRAPSHLLRTERWLSTQAMRMRIAGHRVDLFELDRIETEARAVEAVAGSDLLEITGLRTTQNVALVKWLTEQGLDWEDHPRTDSGNPSLAKDHIPALLARDDLNPDVRAALDAFLRSARVLDRIKRTAEIRSVMDSRGRVHPTLLSVGTVTGRMASSAINMQNFSKTDYEMRGLFIPEPGHVLLSCDFAQVELRVVAALSRETRMIDTILAGGDLHQLTADLLGISRQHGKTVNFLIVYGGGAAKLAAQLNWELPLFECKSVIQRYWRGYRNIAKLAQQMSNQVGLRLISGRYVPTGHYKNGGLKSHANLNYLIQGSSRELLVGAWHRFAAGDPELERMIWFPIHDELVLQVPVDRAEEISQRVSQAMTFDLYGVPIEAEADVLLDEEGVSRWMSGDHARSIRTAALA